MQLPNSTFQTLLFELFKSIKYSDNTDLAPHGLGDIAPAAMPESPRDQRGQGSLKPSFGVSRHGLRGMVASSQHEARGHWV